MTRSIHENKGPANGRISEKKASSAQIGRTDKAAVLNKVQRMAQPTDKLGIDVEAGLQSVSIVSSMPRALSMRSAVGSLLIVSHDLEEALIGIGALHQDNLGYVVRALNTDCPMDTKNMNNCAEFEADASSEVETIYPVSHLSQLHVPFNAAHVSVQEALDIVLCGALSVQAMLGAAIDGSFGGAYSLSVSIDKEQDRDADQFLDSNYLGRTVCGKGIEIEAALRAIQHSISVLTCSLTGGEAVEREKRVHPQGIISTLASLENEVSTTVNDVASLANLIRSELL